MNKLVLLQYDSSDFFVDLCVEINYELEICIGTTMACSRLAIVSNAHTDRTPLFYLVHTFTNDYIVQNKSLGSVHISWNSPISLRILNLKVIKV